VDEAAPQTVTPGFPMIGFTLPPNDGESTLVDGTGQTRASIEKKSKNKK
jgi:hypothetical protein